MTGPASAMQLNYLAILVETREGFLPEIGETLTEEEASALIDQAKMLPKIARTAPPGLYSHGGKVYRVRRSKTSEHLYAEVMEINDRTRTGRWKMAAGMVSRDLVKLTVADAVKAGRDTGVCHVCGHKLVIDDGIHPGCAKKLGVQ